MASRERFERVTANVSAVKEAFDVFLTSMIAVKQGERNRLEDAVAWFKDEGYLD